MKSRASRRSAAATMSSTFFMHLSRGRHHASVSKRDQQGSIRHQGLQERRAGRAQYGVGDEMVDKGVRVQEDRRTGSNIGEGHWSTAQGWLSGPRSASSSLASPFQAR